MLVSVSVSVLDLEYWVQFVLGWAHLCFFFLLDLRLRLAFLFCSNLYILLFRLLLKLNEQSESSYPCLCFFVSSHVLKFNDALTTKALGAGRHRCTRCSIICSIYDDDGRGSLSCC